MIPFIGVMQAAFQIIDTDMELAVVDALTFPPRCLGRAERVDERAANVNATCASYPRALSRFADRFFDDRA